MPKYSGRSASINNGRVLIFPTEDTKFQNENFLDRWLASNIGIAPPEVKHFSLPVHGIRSKSNGYFGKESSGEGLHEIILLTEHKKTTDLYKPLR